MTLNRETALAIALTAVTMLTCTPPGTVTPTPLEKPEGLVGVWTEVGRIGEDGVTSEPDDPLHIGFFPDGTFLAVYGCHHPVSRAAPLPRPSVVV